MQVSLNLHNRYQNLYTKTNSSQPITQNKNTQEIFQPKLITFRGAEKKDVVVYAAESAKVANKGGVGTVAADFGLQAVFDENKYRTALFLPYYNGEVIYETDPNYSAFHPDKPIKGQYKRTEVRYKDGKPIFVKGSMVGKTVNDLKPGEYKVLEEIAVKDIDVPTGKETARIFRILNDETNPNTYLVFTQATGAMREPYGNGTSYSSGAKPLRNVDPYAINNYALTEMLPELEQKGILKPKAVLLNDPHTAYMSEFMAKKAEQGDNFYKNITAGYVVHNPGDGYQQKTSLQVMFSNLATNEEIDMVTSSKVFQEVQKRGEQEEFFKRLIPALMDENGETSPLYLALKHRDNGSLSYCGTVSPGAAESYAKGAGNATGVKKLLGKLYDEGKFIGILNGLNSPDIDPTKVAGLPFYKKELKIDLPDGKSITLTPFQTFDPNNPKTTLDEIIAIKQKNAANLFERINAAGTNPEIVIGMKRPNTKVMGTIKEELIEQIKNNLGKKEFNFDDHVKLYVSWGRADEQKGIDVTIKAFRKYLHQAYKTKAWNVAKNSVLILGGDVQSSHLKDYMYSVINDALKDDLMKGRFAFLDGFAPNAVLSNPASFPTFPSRFAPCELTDHEARTYGGLPVVSGIEGLDDKNFGLDEKFEEKLKAAIDKERESIEKPLLAEEKRKIKNDPKFKNANQETIAAELKKRQNGTIKKAVEKELERRKDTIIEKVKEANKELFTGAKTKSSALVDLASIDLDADPVYSKFPAAEKTKIRKAIQKYNDAVSKFKKDLTAEFASQVFEHSDGTKYSLTADDVAKKVEEAFAAEIRKKGELYTLHQHAQDELVTQELAVKMKEMALLDKDTLKKGMRNNFRMKKGWGDNADLQKIKGSNGQKLSASELYEKDLLLGEVPSKKRLFSFSPEKLKEVEEHFKKVLKEKLGVNLDEAASSTTTPISTNSGTKNTSVLTPPKGNTTSVFDNIFNKQTAVAFLGLAAICGLAYYIFKPEENTTQRVSNKPKQKVYTA